MKDMFKYADKESSMFNELSELKKEFVNSTTFTKRK